uniref:Uncharacterized protein n=1 Tax=Myotis myotis TaxID=51298 RepID=A0A7J7VZ24_MYOMY|nr:hypothetical protein mMyoMyo1_012372 [Myotis myotis]
MREKKKKREFMDCPAECPSSSRPSSRKRETCHRGQQTSERNYNPMGHRRPSIWEDSRPVDREEPRVAPVENELWEGKRHIGCSSLYPESETAPSGSCKNLLLAHPICKHSEGHSRRRAQPGQVLW